jgi:hypothetical protein
MPYVHQKAFPAFAINFVSELLATAIGFDQCPRLVLQLCRVILSVPEERHPSGQTLRMAIDKPPRARQHCYDPCGSHDRQTLIECERLCEAVRAMKSDFEPPFWWYIRGRHGTNWYPHSGPTCSRNIWEQRLIDVNFNEQSTYTEVWRVTATYHAPLSALALMTVLRKHVCSFGDITMRIPAGIVAAIGMAVVATREDPAWADKKWRRVVKAFVPRRGWLYYRLTDKPERLKFKFRDYVDQ